MSAGHELLDRLTQLGASVRPAGDRLILRAGAMTVPAELVRSLREAKSEVLEALAAVEYAGRCAASDKRPASSNEMFWRDRYAARVGHWVRDNRRPEEAEDLAYGEMVDQWRERYDQRSPAWQCAGCNEPIAGLPALQLADENRVHFDEYRQCLIRFGRRWRGEAVDGLRGLGLEPPAGFELL
jgi:hypothetical protein